MPVTVKVNGTANSLVHKGSNGVSMATVPDVCKTPSPGGPVPLPYPNVSQSATLSKGTTTVKADGMMIAIKGSEFSMSNGDNAGTLGGVKSSTFMKESTWISYSFDVKMEGKNACRLTDKKFQNHGNTVDLGGEVQAPAVITIMLVCGECASYSKLQQKRAQAQNEGEQDFERDHIPAKATLRERAFKKAGRGISDTERNCIKNKVESRGIAVAIPRSAHRGFSPTCGNKNKSLMAHDASSKENLAAAVDRDLNAMQAHLKGTDCEAAYNEAAEKIKAHDNEKLVDDIIAECTGG